MRDINDGSSVQMDAHWRHEEAAPSLPEDLNNLDHFRFRRLADGREFQVPVAGDDLCCDPVCAGRECGIVAS